MLVAIIDSFVAGAAVVVAAFITAYIPVRWSSKKTQRQVADLHDEVRTNHGKKPSEYLEMIADVNTGVGILEGKLDSLTKAVGAQGQEFEGLLAVHTREDEDRFDQIIVRLDALDAGEGQLNEIIERLVRIDGAQ